MSDDGFFREVNEELRSDRVKQVWTRYGIFIVAAFLAVIVATSAWLAFDYWNEQRAAASGDRFLEALTFVEEGKTEEARASLSTLAKDGHGSYKVLARMRAATLQAEEGDRDAAISSFSAIANDGSVVRSLRDMARLRAAYLLVDTGTYDDVAGLIETMTGADNPMRHSAREALGLSAYKDGAFDKAREWFEQMAGDPATPRNMIGRANVMLDIIGGAGKPEPAGAPPAPVAAE